MNYKTLFSLAKNDFKAKYAGSVLGAVWAFINPVITILIYWFVFQVAFHNSDIGNVPYVLWLVSGIVPWFFFADAWGGATGSLADYSYLVKKVVFKIESLPLIRVISALFVHLFFVALTFIILFCYGFKPQLIHIQIIYYMLSAFVMVLALGRICAILMAFIKDINNIVGVCVQFGYWLTPVFWNVENIPQNLTFIFKLNPVYYLVEGYRDTFVYNVWFFERLNLTIYFWVISIALLIISNILFKRLRPHIADML